MHRTWKPGLILVAASLVNVASAQDTALYPIVRQGSTGFIDRQGNMVIKPQFDLIDVTERPDALFPEGLQPVSKDGNWGYIDRRGAVRIPFQFSAAGRFSEGLAAVRSEKGYGYIDRSGTFRIRPEFEAAHAFSEGVAWVMRNSKGRYIDKTGSFLAPPQFEQLVGLSSFSEGLAGAHQKSTGDRDGGIGLGGFVDKTGAWVIPPRYHGVSPFRDGLAAVCQEGDSTYIFIDHAGKMVLGPFPMAWNFSEGLARVTLPDGKTAFIDKKGKIQFTLDGQVWVEPFAEGMAQVRIRTEPGGFEKVGYIDRSGKFAIPPVYDAGSSFQDGLAAVILCNQSGYIATTGKPVWGIQSRTKPAAPAKSSTALTPELIARITGETAPITLKESPGSGSCGPFGNVIWSLEVSSTDQTYPRLTISLIEGGTLLSDEKIGNFQAFLERHIPICQPIGPEKNPVGYSFVGGFGPGGSLIVASVFSPERQYGVVVGMDQSAETKRIEDPLDWAGKVALDIRSALFGNGK